MALAVLDEETVHSMNFLWMQRILCLIFQLVMTFIFFAYLRDVIRFARKLCRKKRSVSSRDVLTSSTKKWRELCHVFSTLTLFIYFLMGTNYVLNYWSLYDKDTISCNFVEIYSVLTLHLAKNSLYIVLVLRIKIAFDGSTFKDNPCVRYSLYAAYGLIVAFFFITVLGDTLTISGTLTYAEGDPIKNPDIYFCLLDDMPTWGVMVFLVLDLTLSTLCVVAFNYPLRTMIKTRSDDKIVDLIRRYAVLSTTAICSTFCLIMLVAVTKFGFLSLLDNVVNSTCLLLMSSWYQHIYTDYLCKCCYKETVKQKRETELSGTHLTTTVMSKTPRPTISPSDGKKAILRGGNVPPTTPDNNTTTSFKFEHIDLADIGDNNNLQQDRSADMDYATTPVSNHMATVTPHNLNVVITPDRITKVASDSEREDAEI